MTTTATQTREQQRTCDNCALMDLHICGDGLIHRFCTAMNMHIADWNTEAVCSYHKPTIVRGGVR